MTACVVYIEFFLNAVTCGFKEISKTIAKGGKPVQMSKRTGEFITLKEVISEIGSDTARFIFLTRRQDSHLEFDLEVVKKQSAENPVFYVQYAYARINSIFKKADELNISLPPAQNIVNQLTLKEDEELRIIKKLITYPLIFEGAVIKQEPHRITFYLQDLSALFHQYYNKHRVLNDDSDLTIARLILCSCVKTVLEEGLNILGISAPERM
ncbi:arginyl-tRNA synthetase [Candidatus Magnetoovum chiemensis]|nr:arginyl-tRNA synthetase [Candidatus Magnetoovum chiemensis]